MRYVYIQYIVRCARWFLSLGSQQQVVHEDLGDQPAGHELPGVAEHCVAPQIREAQHLPRKAHLLVAAVLSRALQILSKPDKTCI